MLLKGSSEKIPIDDTDASGVLAISHDCVLGERFYAEPKDVSFFQSNEATCKKELTLIVGRRETPFGVLVQRKTRVLGVKFKDGSQATYLVSASGRVRSQATEERHPIGGPFGIAIGFDTECRVLATGSVEQSITRISDTGGLSALSVMANQSVTPGEQIYNNFRGPCLQAAESSVAILKEKTAGQVDRLEIEASESSATKALTNLLSLQDRQNMIDAMAHPQ